MGPFDAPSHDTFSRVFRILGPTAFAEAFTVFARTFAGTIEGVVAIDGKAMHRAYAAFSEIEFDLSSTISSLTR